MRLISLNTESASQGQIFFDYILEESKRTDIFCFQEVFSAGPGAPHENLGLNQYLFPELVAMLPGFFGIYSPKSFGYVLKDPVDWTLNQGQAIFIRKSLSLKSSETRFLLDATQEPNSYPVEGLIVAQTMVINNGKKDFAVIQTHGISRPGSKTDTPNRLLQSKKLLEILEVLGNMPTILCGDLNLNPDTQSIAMLEQKMNNLIKDFKIENTRNELSWGKHAGDKQHFADYTFTSSNISVNSFEVPYNLVSDHLPMILEFE